jgi:hypothetical protein
MHYWPIIWSLMTPLAQIDRTPPVAPTLIAPADDPNSEHCLTPHNSITLSWRTMPNAYSTTTYVEVRRFDRAADDWRPWVKSYANTTFTLTVNPKNPLLFGTEFAWRVWAVDPTGTAKPYATPSDWFSFCTTAR